jgi:hypothetical protein
MQMGFPDPFSLGESEYLDASIASSALLCTIDRFNWSPIAHNKELEFLNSLGEYTRDGARQKDRRPVNGK